MRSPLAGGSYENFIQCAQVYSFLSKITFKSSILSTYDKVVYDSMNYLGKSGVLH